MENWYLSVRMEENKISHLCQRLLEQLILISSPLVGHFNDGISKTALRNKLKNLSLDLPNPIVEMYQWKNGLNETFSEENPLGEIYLFPLAVFYSIERALEAYQAYAVTHTQWSNQWFPIFESGAGDYYLIDCDRNSETFEMVLYYSPSDVNFNGLVTKYDSIGSLLYSVTECYRQKAYFYDRPAWNQFAENPYLNFDVYKEALITKRYNPHSKYWQIFS